MHPSSMEGRLKETGVDAILVCRSFDATPWKVFFGKLTSEVSEHARYLVADENGR